MKIYRIKPNTKFRLMFPEKVVVPEKLTYEIDDGKIWFGLKKPFL